MEGFNDKILEIIKMFSYPMFIVQQDTKVKCVCVNYDTKQADPSCKKCLGTGKKIKIKKIEGACIESGAPATVKTSGDFFIAKNYYIPSKWEVYQDNIIVDKDEVLFIYQPQNKTSFKGEEVYQKCLCYLKKMDSEVFLKNFNDLVGR
jgi:hypothetical protein